MTEYNQQAISHHEKRRDGNDFEFQHEMQKYLAMTAKLPMHIWQQLNPL